MTARVTAVMLAYGEEPWLVDAARAVLASTGVDLDLVVVDNGCTGTGVDEIKGMADVRVVQPGWNTGYTGGCAAGAAEATGDVLVFVNSDALVEPESVSRIVDVATEPGVGAAMASIRLADAPELINTAGNPLHVAGLSWAGGNGELASRYAERRTVPVISGCCFAIRRQLWERLGGFAPEYFAYHEDVELSLRLWQRGLRLEYVPDAIVRHHYDFSRNDLKYYLVERNRLITLLTAYQVRTLVVLAPVLALTEAAMVATAITGGWLSPKARGWRWLWRHRDWIRRRRRRLQAERTASDARLADLMTARFEPANVAAPPGVGVFNAVVAAYWWFGRRLLG
jgi:GT2 family glycosyltransferase